VLSPAQFLEAWRKGDPDPDELGEDYWNNLKQEFIKEAEKGTQILPGV